MFRVQFLSRAATSPGSMRVRERNWASRTFPKIDTGAIEFIHRKIVALRDEGCAILLVSAELEEVTALSDRLLVIHKGQIVGEVDPKVATTEEIGLMMTGGHR